MPFTDPIIPNPLPSAFALTTVSSNTLYENSLALVAGIYTITFSMGGTVNVDFYNGTTYLGTASGNTGTVYKLTTAATNVKYFSSNSGTFIITLSAISTSTPTTGTLYTFTSSQTINLIGDAYVLLVGAGGAGGAGYNDPDYGTGGGGGSGGIISGRLLLTGSTSLTIGQGGTPTNNAGGNGTSTVLSSLTATGGFGGAGNTVANTGAGGSPGGANGGAIGNTIHNGSASANSNSTFSFFTFGTTGSGGGGGSGAVGGGSGIGTGGGVPLSNGNGLPGTGYGAGGGGGFSSDGNVHPGGAGTNGVCYIII